MARKRSKPPVTIGGKTWNQFVKANVPELIKRDGLTPQQALKACASWWKQYKRKGA